MAVSALEQVRAIIEAWPETSEKISHGAPTWWGGKKSFAVFHDGHYDQGRPSVWILAAPGVQEELVGADPERFFRPKYLGPSGWVAVRLDARARWNEIEVLLFEGYRLVAPKRALAALEAAEADSGKKAPVKSASKKTPVKPKSKKAPAKPKGRKK